MNSMLALSGDELGLSFARGMVASINPCGFVLLPTYLIYFLGTGVTSADPTTDDGQRAGLRRALVVGASVSAGFLAVFLVTGSITRLFTRWVLERAHYATFAVGLGLVVLGVAMLLGYRLPISTPRLGASGERRTAVAMFAYGCAYAVTSISCTIGLYISTMFGRGRADGVVAGATSGLAYGTGMTLVVMGLTVTLAFARTGLLHRLRSAMSHIEMLAAVFVVLSGLYLLYYFWVADLRNDTDPLTSAVERLGTWATGRLSQHWELVALVLTGIIVVAIALVVTRRDPPAPTVVGAARLDEREPVA